jgi:hypothetical protein
MPDSSGPRRLRIQAQPNVLDEARRAFRLLVTGPDPLALEASAVQGMAGLDGLPPGPAPLGQLRELLLARSCPQATRDAVWRELATRSRTQHGAWTVGCVGVALPALTSVVATLTARFADDPADVAAATLTGFLQALAEADLDRPRVMLRLRWAAYRAGHAALTEALDAPRPVPPRFGSVPPTPPWGHPDLVLARAVADAAITRREADVIGATRLEQVAVADWAATHAVSVWATYKLRSRSEARLVAYLLAGDAPATSARRRRGQTRPDTTGSVSKVGAQVGLQLRRQLRATEPAPEDPRCA